MRSMTRSKLLSQRLRRWSITQLPTGHATSIKSARVRTNHCFARLGNEHKRIESHIVQDYEQAVTIGPGFLYRAPPWVAPKNWEPSVNAMEWDRGRLGFPGEGSLKGSRLSIGV